MSLICTTTIRALQHTLICRIAGDSFPLFTFQGISDQRRKEAELLLVQFNVTPGLVDFYFMTGIWNKPRAPATNQIALPDNSHANEKFNDGFFFSGRQIGKRPRKPVQVPRRDTSYPDFRQMNEDCSSIHGNV